MKSKTKMIILLIALVAFGFLSSPAKEKSDQTKTTLGLNKTATAVSKALMNANRVTSWIEGDGFFNWEIQQSWNGEYPKQAGVGAIYSEGIVFGGLCNDGLYSEQLRLTGNTYFNGMQPGKILTNASGRSTGPEAIAPASVRCYGVRPDMRPEITKMPDLTTDAATFFQVITPTPAQIQTIADRYFLDWNEWPASSGAPWYFDTIGVVRNDAAYDPANPHHIPGIPGATKTIWFVCNDLDIAVTQRFAGSPPMGVEQQMTVWAYASSTPLNDIIFKQVKLIYKGNPNAPANSRIDSMYVVQWSDPDNGDAGNDFAGSDSTLNIGYVYNSTTNDSKYAAKGLPAPAVGFVFLQGVSHTSTDPNDSAVVNFQWRKGQKYFHSRPLTAFDYFAANSPISDPDDATYSGTNQWYNLMRGAIPRPEYPAGQPFYESSGYASDHGIVTKYCMSGDPVNRTGWVDGIDIQAGDRRIVNVHGPITLNLGDTAEVVIGLVYGMGADNLTSVKVMKYNTTFAQFAFNNLFKLPSPPPNPAVAVSTFDKEVILDWANEDAGTIERSNNSNFTFQGYNVYQLPSPSASKADWVRIATYDLKNDNVTVIIAPVLDASSGVIVTAPVQFGSESGLTRTQTITTDYIRQQPLVNSQEYYYAVAAYSYNAEWNNPLSAFASPFPSLESSPVILTVIPKTNNPGVRFTATGGDTLQVTHTSPGVLSEGQVYPIVVSADKLTGHTYKVTFQTTGSSTTWNLIDVTANNQVKLSDQTNSSGDANYLIVDGVQVKVFSPSGFKDFIVTANASGPLATPSYAAFAFNSSGFPNTGGYPADDRPDATEQVSGALWGIHTGYTGSPSNSSFTYFLSRTLRDGANSPYFSGRDFEIRFTAGGSIGYDAFGNDAIVNVPFELWDLGVLPTTADDIRLVPLFYDVNGDGAFGLDGQDHSISGGDNDPETDWIYWYGNSTMNPGTAEYDSFAALVAAGDTTGAKNMAGGGHEIFARMTLVGMNLGSVGDPTFPDNIPAARRLPETGTVFKIVSMKPSAASDEFSFIAPAPSYDRETAKADVEKINVFPNPYYGFNARERNRLNKWVKFTHLPANSTIRIFNLAGVLVKTIQPAAVRDQFATWDLRNDRALPVASGIYIVHVDMPDLGAKKILKLAIVQEEQVLPTY
jgi:hypothetical protein